MSSIYVFDLTTDPIYNELLDSIRAKTSVKKHPEHLPSGFSSPMGFWLSTDNAFPKTQGQFEIMISEVESSESEMECQFNQTIVLKHNKEHELTLKLGLRHAHVIAKKTTWDYFSDAILLAITQYWRFLCIESQLNEVSNTVQNDLHYMSKPKLISFKRANCYVKQDIVLQTIMQNMPFFKGPLLIPSRYINAQIADMYLELSDKLNMGNWAEQIDEHLETVGSVYEEITDKLFYHKCYLVEFALELAIVAILLVDFYYK